MKQSQETETHSRHLTPDSTTAAPRTSAVSGVVLARVASNIRRLRVKEGWTQKQTAVHQEMSVNVYHRIETGRSNLTLVTLTRLANGFGVDVAELFQA